MPTWFLRSLALSFAVLLPATTSFNQVSFNQVDTTATVVGWNCKGFGAIPDSRLPNPAQVIANLDPAVIALGALFAVRRCGS